MTVSDVPEKLLAARRYVDEFPPLRLVDDLAPAGEGDRWSFSVDATIDAPARSDLPPTTRWRIVLSSMYPWGSLEAFPDADQGITLTFPHQYCNLPPVPRTPLWRRGLICVRSPHFIFNRVHLDNEPVGAAHRMRWFLQRVIGWLHAATQGALLSTGDPFELPDFAAVGPTVVWSESDESLRQWSSNFPTYGLADVCQVCGSSQQENMFAVRAFQDVRGHDILNVHWGDLITASRGLRKGVWIRLLRVPHLKPYQAPLTWGDMRDCFADMRLSFDERMRRVLEPIRDGAQHFAMFGFPVPKKIGGAAAMMHWQACMLPHLSYGVITRRGFRTNAVGYWRQDCFEGLRSAERINWCQSRNWEANQLTGRGALHEAVRTKRTAIIGAGAVGSVLAELLVRAGLLHLDLVDKDKVEAGNLVRHTLALDDIGRGKAQALAERLRRLSPHVSVFPTHAMFPVVPDATRERLATCDLLVDCSANDEVAHALESAPWNNAGLRASVSLGFGAKRCYVYLASAPDFKLADLQSKADEWFAADRRELAATDLPAEAIGCWHPLFPARIDGVWSMTALAVQEIERVLENPPAKAFLVIFERTKDASGGAAVARRVV